jgi:inositol-phosphate phosphatase / L-galactose 1-phosphate phosphatase / histidinol-phosphatase
MIRDTDIALANRLAEASGGAIRPYFRGEIGIESKSDASPVTLADTAAETAIRAILDAERPDEGIIGEEFGATRTTASRQWVIDPIDGTTSFAAGRPIFGTLIALLEDGWPVLGIIDQPILKERWVGAAGRPTTLNGIAIKTRACRDLASATLATTSPNFFSTEEGARFMALGAQTAHRRIVWGGDCYNYGLLAAGQIDLVVEAGLKLHDFAALVPVVEGAGGQMCDWDGDVLTADSEGDVLALGDPARLDDVLEVLAD